MSKIKKYKMDKIFKVANGDSVWFLIEHAHYRGGGISAYQGEVIATFEQDGNLGIPTFIEGSCFVECPPCNFMGKYHGFRTVLHKGEYFKTKAEAREVNIPTSYYRVR